MEKMDFCLILMSSIRIKFTDIQCWIVPSLQPIFIVFILVFQCFLFCFSAIFIVFRMLCGVFHPQMEKKKDLQKKKVFVLPESDLNQYIQHSTYARSLFFISIIYLAILDLFAFAMDNTQYQTNSIIVLPCIRVHICYHSNILSQFNKTMFLSAAPLSLSPPLSLRVFCFILFPFYLLFGQYNKFVEHWASYITETCPHLGYKAQALHTL